MMVNRKRRRAAQWRNFLSPAGAVERKPTSWGYDRKYGQKTT